MSNLNLMVCPHDTANNPDRWFMFMQYLAKALDTHINFDISLDFSDFHEHLGTADIVYANPTDTLKLVEQHGFTSLVRPSNLHDEVVFVANVDVANPELPTLQGQDIVSVKNMLPTKLGLHLLKARSIEPASIVDSETWTSVIGTIWRGEAQFGMVYKDTYDELSEQGKSMVNAFYSSDERSTFHTLVIGRNALDKKDALQEILLAMHTNDDGKNVLHELHMEQWVVTTKDDLAVIKHIQESY
jgi:ABC-type phosphate/phosphonate transport system substrate-binding protein